MIKTLIVFSSFYLGLSGSPEIFKKTTFFAKSDSIVPNSLESSVSQLEKIEKDFTTFTNTLLEWGQSYHKFRIQLEKDVLSEILSYTGQSDFLKELGKCGVIDNLETEDMITVKNVCFSENSSKEMVSAMLKDIRTKSETCVNVKEKFKNRINQAVNEFFNSESQNFIEIQREDSEKQEEFNNNNELVLLQVRNEDKNFENIVTKNKALLDSLCDEYKDLSNQVKILTTTTDAILSTLF